MKKKGVALWISWVLLMSFALLLSALMYNWIFGFTSDTTVELEKRAFKTQGCDQIALDITDVCQDTQTLYINVTNVKTLRVTKMLFRVYDLYDNPEMYTREIIVRPGRMEQLQLLKQGRTSRVEVVPVAVDGDIEVVCTSRVVAYDDVPSC